LSAPKYDDKIPRKGGFMWASECDLECLQFWFNKFSSSSNPAFAEKDAAKAKKLSYWVKFREENPYDRWKGQRGRMEVVANQPVNKPTIFPWENSRSSTPTPLPDQDPGDNKGDAWEPPGAPLPDDEFAKGW
jgi:hypothetical protein